MMWAIHRRRWRRCPICLKSRSSRRLPSACSLRGSTGLRWTPNTWVRLDRACGESLSASTNEVRVTRAPTGVTSCRLPRRLQSPPYVSSAHCDRGRRPGSSDAALSRAPIPSVRSILHAGRPAREYPALSEGQLTRTCLTHRSPVDFREERHDRRGVPAVLRRGRAAVAIYGADAVRASRAPAPGLALSLTAGRAARRRQHDRRRPAGRGGARGEREVPRDDHAVLAAARRPLHQARPCRRILRRLPLKLAALARPRTDATALPPGNTRRRTRPPRVGRTRPDSAPRLTVEGAWRDKIRRDRRERSLPAPTERVERPQRRRPRHPLRRGCQRRRVRWEPGRRPRGDRGPLSPDLRRSPNGDLRRKDPRGALLDSRCCRSPRRRGAGTTRQI